MTEFKIGDHVKVLADYNNHFIQVGSIVNVAQKANDICVFVEDEKGQLKMVDIRDLEIVHTLEEINADIQTALLQSSLSQFNRVSDYEGGDYVMPEQA